MHNQHAGLSQQLAAQHITERQEQAAQARLARSVGRSRRRRHRWLTHQWWRVVHRPGAAATRALVIGAMLAAMHLAGMTAVAHAQAADERATLRPPTERQVDERVLERQARIQRQADEQAAEPAQGPTATYPRRYPRPEPPMGTGSWLGDDRQAPPDTADSRAGLAVTLAVVALLLAVGAAVSWRLHRRLRPQPTS